jgi:hypothetical protein
MMTYTTKKAFLSRSNMLLIPKSTSSSQLSLAVLNNYRKEKTSSSKLSTNLRKMTGATTSSTSAQSVVRRNLAQSKAGRYLTY